MHMLIPSLVPRSPFNFREERGVLASFPGSPRGWTKNFSTLQAMESWAGPGNEARGWDNNFVPPPAFQQHDLIGWCGNYLIWLPNQKPLSFTLQTYLANLLKPSKRLQFFRLIHSNSSVRMYYIPGPLEAISGWSGPAWCWWWRC